MQGEDSVREIPQSKKSGQVGPPWLQSSEFGADRVVDDDGAPVGKGFHGMSGVAWNDGYNPSSSHLRHAVNRNFEFAFDHFVDLFLRMEVFVDCCAFRKVVMRECHVCGMEVATMPTGQALGRTETVGIEEWHSPPNAARRSDFPGLVEMRKHDSVRQAAPARQHQLLAIW